MIVVILMIIYCLMLIGVGIYSGKQSRQRKEEIEKLQERISWIDWEKKNE